MPTTGRLYAGITGGELVVFPSHGVLAFKANGAATSVVLDRVDLVELLKQINTALNEEDS
jgi:hypothetical protein